MRTEMILSLLWLLTATVPVPEATRPVAVVGKELRSEAGRDLEVWLPDRSAILKLGPNSRAVVAEGGHEVSLSSGSASIHPVQADLFGIQTADIRRHANARIEGADGGVISLQILPNHDARFSCQGGKARISLPGWPGPTRSLEDGEHLVIPAAAEKPDALQ